MSTRNLLRELLHRSGLKPAGLAQRLKDQGVTQPQLSRFLGGTTKEPKRSTLAPVADYYGISVEAFFDEALAAALLRDIADGTFTVQRRKAGARAAPRVARGASAATNAAAIEEALQLLADQIDLVSDATQRQRIAQQLQTLALAPDSAKARQGVLEALAQAAVSQPSVPGIAGQVLDKKLSTESVDVFHQKVKN